MKLKKSNVSFKYVSKEKKKVEKIKKNLENKSKFFKDETFSKINKQKENDINKKSDSDNDNIKSNSKELSPLEKKLFDQYNMEDDDEDITFDNKEIIKEIKKKKDENNIVEQIFLSRNKEENVQKTKQFQDDVKDKEEYKKEDEEIIKNNDNEKDDDNDDNDKKNSIDTFSSNKEKNVDKENEEEKEEIENKLDEINESNKLDESNEVDEEKNQDSEKKKFSERKFVKKVVNLYKAIFSHPEDVEGNISKWFDSNKKFAFLTALIVGVLTHITYLTEMILSQDGLWNSICYYDATAWEVTLGRWGIALASTIVNNLAIPNAVGIISILLVSLSAMFIVDILKLKNKITIFIASACMVVSPVLAGTLLYTYTAVAYCTAMILSVLTVSLIFKKKHKVLNIILATVLFTFSLGIYQSYIGVTVGLTAIKLIRDLFDKEIKIKWFFINGICMCLIVIIGGLLYSHITEKVLDAYDLSEATYKGMDNISVENTLGNLNVSMPKIYEDFYNFYFEDDIVTNSNYSRQEFYKYLFVTTIILEIILIFSSGVWKNPFRVICIVIMNLIIPIAFNVVLLLTTETSTYLLTAAQLLLIIPFAAVICEMSGKKLTFIFKWGAVISMFLVVFTYYLADNCSYMVMKLKYNQAYSTTVRIMDRMEQMEGYTGQTPILIVGIIDNNDLQFYAGSNLFYYTLGSVFDAPVFHGTYSGMVGTWTRFFAYYLGIKVNICNPESYMDIINSDEFKEMDIFPAENSCKMIYGIIVVKLTDDPPLP